jgi:hypothetical protein
MEFEALTPRDPRYPRRLRERLGGDAPTLYFRGPLQLLDRFSMAVIAADAIPGQAMMETSEMFLTVRLYAMNYIGPWQSVMEMEIFWYSMDKKVDPDRRRSLTLCTARGLARETWDNFLGDRFGYEGPFTGFPGKDEFYRRAREGELLWLSITEPTVKRFLRRNILLRNWVACALADVVCVPFSKKGTKSYQTVRKVVEAGIPAFTCTHEVCKDLYALGIPGFTHKTVGRYLESLGASRTAPPPFPAPTEPSLAIAEIPPLYRPRATQQELLGTPRSRR